MFHHLNYDEEIIDASQYLITLYDVIHDEVQHQLSNPMDRQLCIQLCLNLEFEKSKTSVNNANEQNTINWETTYPIFCSEMELVMPSNDIATKQDKSYDKIIKTIEAYVQCGSGWRIRKVVGAQLKIGTYIPYKGGCKASLPKTLKKCHSKYTIT